MMLSCGAYIFIKNIFVLSQATGLGGQAGLLQTKDKVGDKLEKLEAVTKRLINIKFNADTAASMQWNFKPQQHSVKVCIVQ